jgi:hypothetical protein
MDFLFSKYFISTRKAYVTTIMIILARISMIATHVYVYFMDFAIDKVSLSFNDIRGSLGLIFPNAHVYANKYNFQSDH